MVDREEIVFTADHGSHLRLRVQCPECQTTGEVPTSWAGCNIRCRKCGIPFCANLVPAPLRIHDLKQEVKHGSAPRRVLLGQMVESRKGRGTAA